MGEPPVQRFSSLLVLYATSNLFDLIFMSKRNAKNKQNFFLGEAASSEDQIGDTILTTILRGKMVLVKVVSYQKLKMVSKLP